MNQLYQIIRGLNKNRLNTSVIVISMAVGMACFFLIGIFIQREFNSDAFNPDKNRTFALLCDDPFSGGAGSNSKMVHCREGSAEYMQENFAEVESFCRLWHRSGKRIEVNRNSYYDNPIVLNASANFFSFFNYKLISNNPQNALETENDIVISKALALKYFGEILPIGKSLKTGFRDGEKEYFVSGVFEKPVQTTQINFDMVTLFDGKDSRCYVKLNSPLSKQKLEADFERLKADIPSINDGTPGQYYLLSMDDTYFSSLRRARFEASRDKTDLWIAVAIAVMIMGIAVFNYLNLVRNRLNDNVKNYTISRIQGAANKDLVRGFMYETITMLSISFLLGIVLMNLLLPFFNQLLSTNITAQIFIQSNSFLLYLLFLVLVASISYLFALVHVRTQLSTTDIKGIMQTPQRRLPVMSIVQLAAMVVLVICSSIVIKQIQFINNKEIGLDKNVIEVKIPPSFKDKASVFKEELTSNPTITDLSLTTASPLLEHWIVILHYEEDGADKTYHPCGFTGDANYVKTLGIKILEGENFSGNPEVDKRKCLVNKSLADIFPNRKLIGEPMPGNEKTTIIGIVEDFHFSNLKRVIEPGYIEFNNQGPHILVKAKEGKEKEVEASIAAIWNKLIPDHPQNIENVYARYRFLHAENERFIQLIGACCIISIFLSMMGLFALSVDKCIKRIKEIGIRKVNGANVSEILTMLNRDFIKWVATAFVAACPVAWYAMNKWLENFAYKTSLSWWIFALAGALALGIALLTVSWQSWRAATRNPVEALRYE